MCVLHVTFGSKVRPKPFGCVAMGSAVLFILRSILLIYYARSRMNRVQMVLSGFSVRLFCFVQAIFFVGMLVCISWLHRVAACVCRCDGDVICLGQDLNRCCGWW